MGEVPDGEVRVVYVEFVTLEVAQTVGDDSVDIYGGTCGNPMRNMSISCKQANPKQLQVKYKKNDHSTAQP